MPAVAAAAPAGPPARSHAAGADMPDWLRATLLAIILLVTIVGAEAFHDLRAVSNISVSENGNLLNQVLFAGMGMIAGTVILWRGPAMLLPLASWPLVGVALWFVLTTLTSTQPLLSVRRFAMLLMVAAASASLFLIARSVRQMALVFAATALCIVLASYVSLILVPDLSMHTAQDVREPEHDGSWRGVFPHKNEAGAIMVWFIFIGLFCARTASPLLGYALAVLALVFLAFTRAKTPIALFPIALLQSYLCVRWTGGLRRAALLLGPVALMLLVTLGPVFVPALHSLMASVAPDATFTGRTAIWEFTGDAIAKRPVTGFGYGAFWQTSSTFYGTGDALSWVNQAGDAHNGYLNVAVEIGLPGLALTAVWLLVEPLRSIQRGLHGAALDAPSLFLVQCWCFGLMVAVFEGVFYHPTNGGFFIMMTGAFGLRFRTRARLLAA